MLTIARHTHTTFYGVDFSGAANAGEHLWIARGVRHDQRLVIDLCQQASALPGGGRERSAAVDALRNWIAASGDAVYGLDFPFSLPEVLIAQVTWDEFARAFGQTYADADAFRTHCRAITNGRELKRRTDVETATPFCAYNLRMYRQTFFGIRDVLAPLVQASAAAVLPMQSPSAGKPLLLEVCPAVLLKARGLYFPYKGRGAALADARRRLLGALTADDRLVISPEMGALLVADAGGDALDSVLAAYGAFLALPALDDLTHLDAIYHREGKVYP